MKERLKGRPPHRTAPSLLTFGFASGLILLAALPWPPPAAHAGAVSLDGSNCVLFGGQARRRELAVCVAWENEGRTLSVSLIGRPPNHVEEVILRRDGGEPFQTLQLKARPPISNSDVGMLYTDMNFDGHGDLGLMRRDDPTVRRPFHYFLFDPLTKRFRRSDVLELLPGVGFDADKERVVTRWADDTYRYKDTYSWEGDSLRLRTRRRSGSGVNACEFMTFVWKGNRRMPARKTGCP